MVEQELELQRGGEKAGDSARFKFSEGRAGHARYTLSEAERRKKEGRVLEEGRRRRAGRAAAVRFRSTRHTRKSRAVIAARCSKSPAKSWKSRGRGMERLVEPRRRRLDEPEKS